MHNCSQAKETGALLFSGEGDWCSTVLGRRAMRLYCTLDNGSGAVPTPKFTG